MPHVAIDTSLADSDAALEFCDLLGEDERACWYLVKLWSWGINANRVDGTVPAAMARTPARLAAKIGYLGDPGLLWKALTAPLGPEGKAWLEPREGGAFYMRGWSRQRRFFTEKARLSRVAERRRQEKDQRRDAREQAAEEAKEGGPEPEPEASTQPARVQHASVTRAARHNTSPSPSPYRRTSYSIKSPKRSGADPPRWEEPTTPIGELLAEAMRKGTAEGTEE